MGLDFVDLFCGIGTIRMGFEQAGHRCVYSVEWDKHKRKIYSIIFGGEPEGADIRAIRHTDIPRADCWCFGAPCQDFSIAGKRAGMEGERSSLVLEVFRLVRETPEEDRPRYLLYENVKGMLSSNGGRDFLGILSEMASLGYDRIEYSLLNSKNFGVPQNRERVFTIGHFRGRRTGKVFPIGRESENSIVKIGDLQLEGRHESSCRVYSADGLSPTLTKCEGGGLQHKIAVLSDSGQGRKWREQDFFSALRVGGDVQCVTEPIPCLTPDRIEKRQNGRRFKEPGEPMFTLTKQDIHGVAYGIYPNASPKFQRPPLKGLSRCLKSDGHHPAGVLQNMRIRKLTPKECWRLQGIPDEITDKVIQAGISDTQMYRAAGDACTVNVIYEIAKKLT